MKKLLIIPFLFLSCTTETEYQEKRTNQSSQIEMPYWYRGDWTGNEGLTLHIEEHKIVMQLPDTTITVTTATQGAYSEDYNYNTLFLDDGSTMGFSRFDSNKMTVSLDEYSDFYTRD